MSVMLADQMPARAKAPCLSEHLQMHSINYGDRLILRTRWPTEGKWGHCVASKERGPVNCFPNSLQEGETYV